MPSIFKGTGLQKRRKKISRRISPPIFSLLTYLVISNLNNLLLTRARSAKKTKTIKELFGVVEGKKKVIVMTFLLQVPTLSRTKEKISFISNVSTTKKKALF